jgi:DNA repair exonuclease SbcCD nuclease subunit
MQFMAHKGDVSFMKIKIINISDIHFGATKNPKKLYKELTNCLYPFIEEYKPNLLVISGDLFDRKLSLNEAASRYVLNFIEDLRRLSNGGINFKIRIIKGTITHDYDQLENFKNLEVDSAYCDFRVITKSEVEEVFPQFYVWFIPEEYPEDYKEFYKGFTEQISDDIKYDMIFGHGTFDFAAFQNQIQESERHLKNAPVFSFKEFSKYCHGPIIFGHIHNSMAYKDKCYYSGSFSRFSHGEENPKGFIYCEYDTETTQSDVSFVENEFAPKYVTVGISDIVSEGATIEEKVAAIQNFNKKKNMMVRIKLDFETVNDPEQLVLIKQAFSNDETIKLDMKEKFDLDKKESDEDKEFEFITKRQYDLVTTVQMWIKKVKGIDIEKSIIEDAIRKEDAE